jgi:mono/diheme cytochrome c family protein
MTNRFSLPAVLVCVLAALAGPAARGPAMGAEGEPRATPAPPASPPKSITVPEAERNRKNPVPNVPDAVESGRNLFASQCAMCHGAKADGRGDLAAQLKIRVPDLTDPDRQKKRTDGEWFYIIGHGHGDMPAEKRLNDQQKWEMILYLRTLAKRAPG